MFSQDDISCPITHETYIDPVILEGDGYTYERSAIEKWLENHFTSPVTGSPVKRTGLIPNYLVRQLADRAKGNDTPAPIRSNLLPREDSVETCRVVIQESDARQTTTNAVRALLSKITIPFMSLVIISLLIGIMVQGKVLTVDEEGMHIGQKNPAPAPVPTPVPTPVHDSSPCPPHLSPPSPSPTTSTSTPVHDPSPDMLQPVTNLTHTSPPLPHMTQPPNPDVYKYAPPEQYQTQPPNPDLYSHDPPEQYQTQPPNPDLYNHDSMSCYHTCYTCDGAGQYDCLTCAPDFPHFILNLPPHLSADSEYTDERGENNGRGACYEN